MDVLLKNKTGKVTVTLESEHPLYPIGGSLRKRVVTQNGFEEVLVPPKASTPTTITWELLAEVAFYKVSVLMTSTDKNATGDERVFVKLRTVQKVGPNDEVLEAVWDTSNPERKLTKVGSTKKKGEVVASKVRYRDMTVNLI